MDIMQAAVTGLLYVILRFAMHVWLFKVNRVHMLLARFYAPARAALLATALSVAKSLVAGYASGSMAYLLIGVPALTSATVATLISSAAIIGLGRVSGEGLVGGPIEVCLSLLLSVGATCLGLSWSWRW